MVVVSHDEELLRGACESVAEVRAGGLETYKGMRFDAFQKERDERAKRAISLYVSNGREEAVVVVVVVVVVIVGIG